MMEEEQEKVSQQKSVCVCVCVCVDVVSAGWTAVLGSHILINVR